MAERYGNESITRSGCVDKPLVVPSAVAIEYHLHSTNVTCEHTLMCACVGRWVCGCKYEYMRPRVCKLACVCVYASGCVSLCVYMYVYVSRCV